MVGQSWKRPSVAVVLCSVVVIAVAVARGDLRLERDATAAAGSSTIAASRARRSGEPVVVKPERAARTPSVPLTTVRGRVFDARGYLVVGAEISARGQPTVRTDADGIFRSTVVGSGTAQLLVRHPGHRPRWLSPSSLSPDPLLVLLDPAAPWDPEAVEPAAGAPALTGEGIVRGVDGRPLVGAYVMAKGSDSWTRTDEIGRYVLPLREATATIVVHQPDPTGESGGFAAASDPLVLERKTGVVPLPELVAAAGAAIRGTLRDERGNAVAGVPVLLRGDGFSRVFESGTSGAFRIAGLLPGHYELRAMAYRGAIGSPAAVTLDRPVVDCELQLRPLEERRLRVQDEHGSAVGLAYVAAAAYGARRSVAQADADGWAAVCVAPGDTQFEVRGGPGGAALPVRRYESEQAILVVAAP